MFKKKPVEPKPKPQPVVQPKPEPVVQPKPEPVIEKKPEPIVEVKPEPMIQQPQTQPEVRQNREQILAWIQEEENKEGN